MCYMCTENIGGKDVFKCTTPEIPVGCPWLPEGRPTRCGTVRSRDGNGAFNILLRGVATALDPTLIPLKAMSPPLVGVPVNAGGAQATDGPTTAGGAAQA